MAGSGRRNADAALIAALAAGLTQQQAAKQTGVGERTVYRRLQEPGFRAEVQAARRAVVEQAIGVCTASSVAAAKTLLELLAGAESEAVRLATARTLLSEARGGLDWLDLEARVAELERRVGEHP